MQGVGLVLEGGGMRGVYTAGVLECFLEAQVSFPYCIGVSAGACNAASYLSRQKGRNKQVNIDYITDPRYLSWRNYFKNKEFFGMDFIFDEIPNRLVPYDYETFYQNPSEFVVGTTDCITGEAVYYGKKDYNKDLLIVLRASSSLPFGARETLYQGRYLLDGGISDSIPIKKAQQDGYGKNVVILTRHEGYRKKPSRFDFFVKRTYRHYPGLQRALLTRYQMYNETLAYLEKEKEKGNVILIRPAIPLQSRRLERDPNKLELSFKQGFRDAERALDQLNAF